jgi:hypothetical protein
MWFCPFVFLLPLLISCRMPLNAPSAGSYAGMERVDFEVVEVDGSKTSYYTVKAILLAENDSCYVYADHTANLPVSMGERIAREYGERIAPGITGVFGNYYPLKKITILLLDIKDGYKLGGTYVAGYFSAKDIFPKSFMSSSNEMPMLYIDINPGKPGSNQFYSTIAHELQHLINFSSRYQRKNPGLDDIKDQSALDALIESIHQDEWVDEGLSSAAEYIYNRAAGMNSAGKWHVREKIDHYNNAETYYSSKQSNIAAGNNFFTWGENDNFIYDDYVTVYLFFQWLRIHAGDDADGDSIYRSIIESEYGDYRAVTSAVRKHIPRLFEKDAIDDHALEWERLLETWLAANYVNAPKKDAADGLFGYNAEFTLIPAPYPSGKTVSLRPGEGVYSNLGNETFYYPPALTSSTHIRYAGLSKTENPLMRITQGGSGTGEMLITFNANHAKGSAEKGALADIGPAPADLAPSGRAAGLPPGPLPIDIRPPLHF